MGRVRFPSILLSLSEGSGTEEKEVQEATKKECWVEETTDT